MRAAVGDLVSADHRGSAYGVFNTGYGVAWFLGSTLMGILHDVSLPHPVLFSVAIHLVSVAMLLLVKREASSPIRP